MSRVDELLDALRLEFGNMRETVKAELIASLSGRRVEAKPVKRERRKVHKNAKRKCIVSGCPNAFSPRFHGICPLHMKLPAKKRAAAIAAYKAKQSA